MGVRISRMRKRIVPFAVIAFVLAASVALPLAASAQRGGGSSAPPEVSIDYICVNPANGVFYYSATDSCPGRLALIVVEDSYPVEFCVNNFTGVITATNSQNGCSSSQTYMSVDGETASFFACANIYTNVLAYRGDSPSDCRSYERAGAVADFRGTISKYACVEENLNPEGCDFFAAGPQNEIRQIGPIFNTSGGFIDCQWQWAYDGNTTATQSCNADGSNASIEAALETLPGIDDVVVTGGPIAGTIDAPIRIEFVGALALTDVAGAISVVPVASTNAISDVTIIDGSTNSPGLTYAAPGGMVEIYEATTSSVAGDPATYGPLVFSGATDPMTGLFTAPNMLEGDYVVCATGTNAVAPSCEVVTIFGEDVTLVNDIDLLGVVAAEVVQGTPVNEVQSYNDFYPFSGMVSGGIYTVSFMGQTTASLAWNADAAAVDAALEALSTVGAGNVSVTGTGPGGADGPMVVEFTGALAGTNVEALVIDNTSLTGAGLVGYFPQTDVEGNAGVEHVITADERVSGGDFTLTFGGATTAALPFNATAADIQAALAGLTSVGGTGGTVTATGGPLDDAPVTVIFGGALDGTTLPITVDNTNIS